MLFYLDTWLSARPDFTVPSGQNRGRKAGLNENYARELMELHTLGVDGGYTQTDVTEVARAFPGWSIDRPRVEGRFVFRPRMHDTGEKVVLGHRLPAGGGRDDGYVVLGSETGLLDIPPQNVQRLGRLQPGKLFLVDLERGCIVEDEQVKREVSTRRPYGEWYARSSVHFSELPRWEEVTISDQPLHPRQRAFGYTQEDLRVLLAPMARDAQEPIGSMGNDLSLAVFSEQAPPLFSYFKQLFAQVTNPPIDSTREEIVMSLATSLGSERNLFEETPEHAHKLILDQPILLNRELETLRHVSHEVFAAKTIDITWPVEEGAAGMSRAIEGIFHQGDEAIAKRVNIIVLS